MDGMARRFSSLSHSPAQLPVPSQVFPPGEIQSATRKATRAELHSISLATCDNNEGGDLHAAEMLLWSLHLICLMDLAPIAPSLSG